MRPQSPPPKPAARPLTVLLVGGARNGLAWRIKLAQATPPALKRAPSRATRWRPIRPGRRHSPRHLSPPALVTPFLPGGCVPKLRSCMYLGALDAWLSSVVRFLLIGAEGAGDLYDDDEHDNSHDGADDELDAHVLPPELVLERSRRLFEVFSLG
eukprot:CAMPEP_0185155254 /NCGR_PEP_ID=MMETSP1139-20130426/311_1 /TAXON_ID=298111 /ORGANISM="Pavlova sp., Strain CCMP459" /LENGTH=154 /DNA_ID=CAMNT_0027720143 /DNA_START=173 /DNA_END=637 /DNA_ORIENTATION=-